MKIVLAENFRTVFYTPFYAAYAGGEFAKQGIDIQFVESPTPGSAITQMYEGHVNLVWGGPLRAIKLRDENIHEEKALYAFGEVVGKDPFFIVSAKSMPDFSLKDLEGSRFGVVNEVPTPWLCLQEDLRDHGVDMTKIQVSDSRTMPENLEALRNGELDFIQVFEPFVTLAEMSSGHVVYASASRGMTAYTTFLSTPSMIENNREAFTTMVSVIENMRQWINSEDPGKIADVVKQFYPNLDKKDLETCIARYQKIGLWTCHRVVSRDGFLRLRQSMKNSGFITKEPAYEECVAIL